MDFDVAVLEYCFDDTLKTQFADQLPFETVDCNFAPVPSFAVGIRTEGGDEFGVIYAPHYKELLVFGELHADRAVAATMFRGAFPELAPFEVPATFQTVSVAPLNA